MAESIFRGSLTIFLHQEPEKHDKNLINLLHGVYKELMLEVKVSENTNPG